MKRSAASAAILSIALAACANTEPAPAPPAPVAPKPAAPVRGGPSAPSVDPLGAPKPGDFDPGPEAVTLLLGGAQGTYMAIGEAVARRSKDLAIQPLASSGSVENLYLVGLGQADAGFVQANILSNPRYALAAQWVDVLCAPFEEEVHLVTRPDTGIRSLADLKGRRVSLGGRASGTTPTARALLAAAGLDFRKDIKARRASVLDSLALLENGAIDAAFMVGGAPLPEFLAVPPTESDERLSLVPIAGLELDQARAVTLPPDMYSWVGEPIQTLAVPCFLVARKDLDPARRQALTALFSKPASAGEAHPKAAQFGALKEARAAIPEVDTAAIKRETGPFLALLGAGAGGTYDRIARGIQAVAADRGESVVVINTQGSFRNLLLLAGGNADLAIVQRDVIERVRRSERFRPLLSELRVAARLFREEVHLIARKGATIKAVEDLEGLRVHTGFAASGTAFTALGFLGEVRVRPDRGQTQDAIMKLLGGQLDAVLAVGGAPLELLAALPESYAEDIGLVSLELDGLARAPLPADTYRFAPQARDLPATEAVLLARKEVPAERLEKLLIALAAQRQNLISSHPKWAEVDPTASVEGLKLPPHPGLAGVKERARLDSAPPRSWALADDEGPPEPGLGEPADEAGGVEQDGEEPR